MEFFEAVNSRASYRWKYESIPVPREDLKKIIEAGLAAPSGCNLQTTHIVGIDDPELIARMGALLDKGYFATAPAAVTEPFSAYLPPAVSVNTSAAPELSRHKNHSPYP